MSSNDGVPWFYTSCCSTCPTYQGSYWNDSPHPMVSYLDEAPDLYGNTTANVCGGAVQYSTNSSHNFVGVNRMEFFIR